MFRLRPHRAQVRLVRERVQVLPRLSAQASTLRIVGFFSRYSLTDVMCALHHANQKLSQLGITMGAVQDAVDQVAAQLAKAKAEIVAKVAELEAQVAAGETPDLTALKAAAQALDDVVLDVPVEEPPVDEPPAEPVV